jgi:glycerate dehydrogenase
MNIAILNECFLEKSHLARLRTLGNLTAFNNTKSEIQAIRRLKNVDVAIIHCSLLPITARILKNASSLRYISLASTGYDLVDMRAARSLGITISNLPSYGTESVAEHAIALMFAVTRNIRVLDLMFRKHPYEINSIPDIVTSSYRAITLRDRTLGVIGLGRIGSRVAQIAQGIGMNVIATDCVARSMPGVRMVPLTKLLRLSDVVTIHTPLDTTTKSILGKKEFAAMQPHAILINTARGGLVDQRALYRALSQKKIAGAGLDTIDDRRTSNPLIRLPNVIFTPHSAWYSDESCRNIADIVTRNVEAYIHKKPINVIL